MRNSFCLAFCLLVWGSVSPSSLFGQCPFDHSPYAWLTFEDELYVAADLYPGEYVSFRMEAGVCYSMVVIDTAELPLHLSLYDRKKNDLLGRARTEGGEALALTYQPLSDQLVNLALNLADCADLWQPVRLLVEERPQASDCRPPR